MSLTRANVEVILIGRIGSLFTAVGLDGTTNSGGNEDLNDAIGYAIRQLGGTVTSVSFVVDGDLSSIGAGDYDELFDTAEIRAMQTALISARRLVTMTLGPRREELSDLADGLAVDIKQRQAWLKDTYGTGLGTLEAGVVNLNFQQKYDSDILS